MPSERTHRLRTLFGPFALAAILTVTTPTISSAGAAFQAPEPAGTHAASIGVEVPVGSAGNTFVIPPEFVPPQETGISGAPADLLAGAAVAADFTGDIRTREAALAQMAPAEREGTEHALEALRSPVSEPDFSDPTTHIVALGNGLNPDGSVHPNLANRLGTAEALALENPQAPLVMSGGQTEHGHIEAEAMRDWLVDRGLPKDRIHVEGRSWSTISNAWHTHAQLPELTSVVVATSESHLHRAVVDFSLAYGPGVAVTGAASPDEPPVPHDPEGERFSSYRDAVMWYLLPDHVTADGVPPIFGAGVPRFF